MYTDGYLEITPADINTDEFTVSTPEDVVYDGNEQKQTVTVKTKDGTNLVEGKDFTLTYSEDVTNVGTVTIKIKGIGNYTGTVTRTYKITERSITVSVADADDVKYDGKEHESDKPVVFDNVVDGQTATIGYTPAKGTLVGTYTGSFGNDLKIVDAEGNDVTKNYKLKDKTPGKLTITSDNVIEPEKKTEKVTTKYALGDMIPFKITVKNITDTEVKNVAVSDPTATIVSGSGYTVVNEHEATIASIAAGGTMTVNVEHKVTDEDIVAGEYVNEATVKAPDNKEITVEGSTTDIEKPDPKLSIAVTVDGKDSGYKQNETVNYSIVVTNDGNVTLHNIKVTDPLTGDEWTIATLEPGKSSDPLSASHTVTAADVSKGKIENTVSASEETYGLTAESSVTVTTAKRKPTPTPSTPETTPEPTVVAQAGPKYYNFENPLNFASVDRFGECFE